jgi:patatin-like phospholipase/acyl hydrolase
MAKRISIKNQRSIGMRKILSIDGGGIRGLIPAMILARIEEKTKQPISESFDLIAGTSTGGILALGLSMKDANGNPEFSANDLREFYEKKREEIFPYGTFRSMFRYASGLFGLSEELYSYKGLERLLKEEFGEATLADTLTNVLISTYDIVEGTPLFFKSWNDRHRSVKMRDVARATSAAPTYFEPHQITITYLKKPEEEVINDKTFTYKVVDGQTYVEKTYTLVDGGVFINSPAVSAYAEAKRMFPSENDFLVVSLGTGQINPEITFEEAKDWGLAYWVQPLIKFMFDGVADAAHYQLQQLLNDADGKFKRYYRMQVDLPEESGPMDLVTEENIKRLIKCADRLIADIETCPPGKPSELEELCKLLTSQPDV